ncbi:MAG: DEAD/DEAH box helicase family protein [Nitrospirae bacterium]|nr:DEAD/DEAH box helicase family protein [Nitrospirota bacterium]MBF0533939.1 DEAD/DEAH box helicase family protein [Nitrospirota bacterium]MBF0618023.1 DEAD/DEAH box helicase family protein [Nitrospirota bacterium]
MEALAHSARAEQGIPPQTYAEHVINVLERTQKNASEAAKYFEDSNQAFVDKVAAAALFHDLGKLDDENQKVLRNHSKKKLPINHVDAGCVYLKQRNQLQAAFLIYSHHAGLCSLPDEVVRDSLFCRVRDIATQQRTNELINDYKTLHEDILDSCVIKNVSGGINWNGLTYRLGLSCLVDADHSDTAQHYENEGNLEYKDLRWEERLRALDKFVETEFKKDPYSARNLQRQEIYDSCRKADTITPIQACESPVGTGKTTSVMAHLLQAAITKKLRHIIVVLPYTNIIKQSVKTYRKALVLAGESPEQIVAEHHHQADFESKELRSLSSLWKSPIIVTTAVQFFETLGSNMPAKLRKLHELPGSAIFIDEAHAAIPSWLWPQTWLWFKNLTNWGCHFVLASGSLPRFWTMEKFVSPTEQIPDLVLDELRQRSSKSEFERITYRTCDEPFDRKSLIDFIMSQRGPRLVIMNTIQSAAVVANEMQKAGHTVLHLSTALTPVDRNRIVNQVVQLLKQERNIETKNTDWTLVATSCIEAGMDFSFATALRESCNVAGLIQIGGRVNRNHEGTTRDVWDFRVLDPLLNRHPSFETSRAVLDNLFKEQLIQKMSATDVMTEGMRREIMSNYSNNAEDIKKSEKKGDYPKVSELYRVIKADTRIVVVDKKIIEALENHEKVTTLDLLRNSVQIWFQKINALTLENVKGYDELFKWTWPYDPDFLGIMKGVLPLVYAKEDGLIF